MNRYSVRPAAMSDIEAVYELIAEQRTIDFGSPMISLEDLQKRWEATDLDTDTITALEEGNVAGYAELYEGDTPFIYLASRNDLDLGYQLLHSLEQQAIARTNGTVELVTQISEKNQPLIQLFASSGYCSNLSFIIMELKLDKLPESPKWAEGISVRSFVKSQDEEATYRTDEEAGEDKGYHTPLSYEGWVKRMGMDRETFDPDIWFLACDGNEIVGAALNICDPNVSIVWVDHLSVRRAWRKRGIGKALLLHSFAEFYKRGIKTAKLSVDSKSLTNAPRLYESVGMRTIQQYHIYRKELRM